MRPLRAKRLAALPPYLFVEIDRKRRARLAAGADIINLGIGDPDRPTPGFIVEALSRAARDSTHHRYPPSEGTSEFRAAAARFMKARYGVDADPDRHICACIGSKEGIAHLPLAIVDPGDVVLVPQPGYPVYLAGALFAGGRPVDMPLTPERGWLPDLGAIPRDLGGRAALLWANYPNNPTGACAGVGFYDELLGFAGERGIVVASDQAYSEVYFEERPPSLWQARSADLDRTLAIEFQSLSKTFNMTGWRIGFAVGHPEVVGALSALKGNCDSGQFGAIQAAGAVALNRWDDPEVAAMREVYRARRDAIVPALRAIGCQVDPPRAGFFVWARCPEGSDGKPMESEEFAARALEEADVVVVPGRGFAEHTRHHIRIALTVEVPRLEEAAQRLRRVRW